MLDLNDYNYSLPASSIALRPATPRDASKLLVYDTAGDSVVFDRFYRHIYHEDKEVTKIDK